MLLRMDTGLELMSSSALWVESGCKVGNRVLETAVKRPTKLTNVGLDPQTAQPLSSFLLSYH